LLCIVIVLAIVKLIFPRYVKNIFAIIWYRLFFIDINSDSSESNKSKAEAFTLNRDETKKVGEESLDNFYANI
jgi:hypothetical protein